MPYKITTFDGVSLPEYDPIQDRGAPIIESYLQSTVGGSYNVLGSATAYPRRHILTVRGVLIGELSYLVDHAGNYLVDHNGTYLIAGTAGNDMRAQYEAIAAKHGMAGTLVRTRLDDSVTHQKTARMTAVRIVDMLAENAIRVQCEFESEYVTWRATSSTTANCGFSAGSAASFNIGNGGTVAALDGIFTITASSAITEITITNSAAGVELVFTGALNNTEVLVIDCGEGTVQVDGIDAYGDFALGDNHTARSWAPVALGQSTWQIVADGSGTFALSYQEQWY